MKTIKKKTELIPSWLFAGLYNSAPYSKWTEEKQEVAIRILKALNNKAEWFCWDISKIVAVNKDDNIRGYFPSEKNLDLFWQKVEKRKNEKKI